MERQQVFFWWAVCSVGVMLAGSFGPWARILGIVSVNGTDGDGWFVIGVGMVALALLTVRRRRRMGVGPALVALMAALGAAAAAIYDWTDLHRVSNTFGLVEPGWGIYAASVGSVSLALACLAIVVTAPGPAEAPAAQSPSS